jgi:putative flippase GtrA
MQFAKYLSIGLVNTVLTLGLMVCLPIVFGLDYLVSYTIGMVTGFIVSFILNSKITFQAKNVSMSIFLKYLCVFGFCYFVSYNIVLIAVVQFDWLPIFGQLSGMGVYTISSYFLFRTFVFKHVT